MARNKIVTFLQSILSNDYKTRPVDDFYKQVVNGNIEGAEVVRIFGRDPGIGTSPTPVTSSNTYQMPTTAQALEVVSSLGADSVGGGGGTKVYVEGLDDNWSIQSETVTLNGTTPVNLVNSYTRVFKLEVSESEAYATATTSSHVGEITLRDQATSAVIWAKILLEGTYGLGESLIGCYTVPAGKKATLYLDKLSVDAGKNANIFVFIREGADDTTTPYTVMGVRQAYTGISGTVPLDNIIPIEDITGAVDIVVEADVTSGNADVSIDYFVILEDV